MKEPFEIGALVTITRKNCCYAGFQYHNRKDFNDIVWIVKDITNKYCGDTSRPLSYNTDSKERQGYIQVAYPRCMKLLVDNYTTGNIDYYSKKRIVVRKGSI